MRSILSEIWEKKIALSVIFFVWWLVNDKIYAFTLAWQKKVQRSYYRTRFCVNVEQTSQSSHALKLIWWVCEVLGQNFEFVSHLYAIWKHFPPEPALLKTSNQTLKHHESNLSQKLHWDQRECISLMPGQWVYMKTFFDPDRSPTLLKPWAFYRCT